MLLSQPDILEAINNGGLRFTPVVDPARVEQVSVDLHLGRKFTRFKNPPAYIGGCYLDPSIFESEDLWDRQEADQITIQPNDFVLGQTLERVSMPPDLAGLIEGRSSFARVGISIHVTAPKIDPGFDAHITLEMTNHGRLPVILRAGIDRPAQLMLFKISQPLPPEQLYGQGAGDLFQHQTEPIPRAKS